MASGSDSDDLLNALKSFALNVHNDEEILSIGKQSTLEKTRREVKMQMDVNIKYRVDILQHIGVFSSLTEESLHSAAQIMEEIIYSFGDYVFRQGDAGDAFYILEDGLVEISRKSDPNDPTEELQILRVLKTNDFFGEIALMTSEARSANVRVVSESAKILKMRKADYIELTSVINKKMAESRQIIGRDTLRHIPLFSNLSSKTFSACLNACQSINFLPNIYICKQGMLGNSMYIITEGQCKVSIKVVGKTPAENREIQLPNLHPGDYFGELSLTDRRHLRPATVLTIGTVHCLQLSKSDFENLVKGEMGSEILGEKSAFARNINKFSSALDVRSIELMKKRRVSASNINGTRCLFRVSNIMKRLAKHFFESLAISMYFKMYRVMILSKELTQSFGDHAVDIMKSETITRYECVLLLQQKLKSISEKPLKNRNLQDIKFICGLLNQRNELKNKYCETWSQIEFFNLCRCLQIVSFPKFRKIYEIDDKCSCAYLILRGCVRLFSQNQETGTMTLDCDLSPGEIFGQEALTGAINRTNYALAISVVDVIQIEFGDYVDSQDKATSSVLSVEDKVQFLQKVNVFKDWERFRLYRIAQNLQQEAHNKGTKLISKGTESKNMYFIFNGRVDVLSVHQKKAYPISSLNKFEYFGETSCLNTRRKNKVYEEFDLVSTSRVDILVLPPESFDYLDNSLFGILSSLYFSKIDARHEILQTQITMNKFKTSKRTLLPTLEAPSNEKSPKTNTSSVSNISTSSDIQLSASSRVDDELASVSSLPTMEAALKTTMGTEMLSPQRLTLAPIRAEMTIRMSAPPIYLDPLKRLTRDDKVELDDIPNLVGGGFDPLMLSSCGHPSRLNKLQKQIAACKKPKYKARTSI